MDPLSKKSQSLSSSFRQCDRPRKLQRHYSQLPQTLAQNQMQSTNQSILSSMIGSAIQKINQKNNLKQNFEKWQLIVLDEKRKMKGIKAKIKWRNQKLSSTIILRLNFINFNHVRIEQDDILIQIEEMNIELSLKQLKKIQQKFTVELQKRFPEKRTVKFIQDQDIEDPDWLEKYLQALQNLFKQFENKKITKSKKIDKQKVNGNYIMYHPPVVLAWNPQGSFCLTQNKIPSFRKSFICNRTSFRQHLQPGKIQRQNIIKQDDQIIYESQSQQKEMFNWNIDEQLEFMQKVKDLQYETKKQQKQKQEQKTILIAKKSSTIVLSYLNQVPEQIRKIFVNYFNPFLEKFQKFHRQDKLKIYFVQSCNKMLEHQILYLINRINSEKTKNIMQIVMETQFLGYQNLLNTDIIDEFKYLISKDFLKIKINQGQILASLKAIIIQNEYFFYQLEHYFKKNYQILDQKPPFQIQLLGSFQQFNSFKCQNLLLNMLKYYPLIKMIKRTESQAKFNFITWNKRNLSKLKIDWLLNDRQRNEFYKWIIPLIWIRERNYLKFQYRQVARIIVVNTLIVKYYNTMNELVKKFQEGKTNYLSIIDKKYEQFKGTMHIQEEHIPKNFMVYCHCGVPSVTYQLSDNIQLTGCQKCKNNNIL